jgi:serine/threonine protein kinase
VINRTAVGERQQSASASERSMSLAPRIIKSRYRVDAIASVSRDVVVYAAEDVRSGRQIALEVPRDEFAVDSAFVAALCEQANKLAKSVHVNRAVARVYECDKTEEGDVFVAREPVDGRLLREALDERGALDPYTALRIASQVGEALEMLHQNGIVHGELGPESVLMVKDDDGTENPRLAGVELTAAHRTTIGLRLRSAASLAHLAPEQVESGQTTEAADIYALGWLLREMLTANTAREADGIRLAPLAIPPVIDRIITTALETRPGQRYPDISVMVNDIWGAHTELSEPRMRSRAVTPPPSANERARGIARSIVAVAPAVAAAAIVVAVIAWAAMSDRIASLLRPAAPAPAVTSAPVDGSAAPAAVDTGKSTLTLPPSTEASKPDAGKPSAPVAVPAVVETPASAPRPPVAEAPAPVAPEPARPPQPTPTPPPPAAVRKPPVARPERSTGVESRPAVERSTTSEPRGPTTAGRRESAPTEQRAPSTAEPRVPATTEPRAAAPAEPRAAAPAEPRGPAATEQRAPASADQRGGESDGSAIIDWLLKDRR